MRSLAGVVPFFICAALGTESIAHAETLVFKGICDASAAVALDESRIIVGDDEKAWLSIYSLEGGDRLEKIDLPPSPTMASGRGRPAGGRHRGGHSLRRPIVWISSNGRTKKGDVRSERFQLFVSHRLGADGQSWASGFSQSFHGLPAAVAATTDAGYAPLREAIGNLKKKDKLAPKKHGLNVEGLSVSRDGKDLLIGLRNPQPGGKAVLFTVENAAGSDRRDDDESQARSDHHPRSWATRDPRHRLVARTPRLPDCRRAGRRRRSGARLRALHLGRRRQPRRDAVVPAAFSMPMPFHPEAVVPLLERSGGKLDTFEELSRHQRRWNEAAGRWDGMQGCRAESMVVPRRAGHRQPERTETPMSLKHYGVLRGRVVAAKREDGESTPHYQVQVKAAGVDYRLAVNVKSQLSPSELLFLVDENFRHPVIGTSSPRWRKASRPLPARPGHGCARLHPRQPFQPPRHAPPAVEPARAGQRPERPAGTLCRAGAIGEPAPSSTPSASAGGRSRASPTRSSASSPGTASTTST